MDYRSLNAVTPQLQCQIPMLDDMLSKIGNAKFLSKMDLQKGFYQIGLEESSRDYTAFVIPWGNFRFRVFPFGLKNAPAIFQNIMVRVLRNCCDFATVCIDDILVFSDSLKDHLSHIRQVLVALG